MDRSQSIVRVSVIGIAANVALAVFKAAVGLLAGSIAVVLDAVNNLSDAFSSVVTIIGTKLANRPPDRKHPYGHGRIEYVSSVAIAIIVLLAGVASFRESVDAILHPEKADYTLVTVIVVAAAVVVKLILGRFVKKSGEKLRSESLVASGTDAFFDAIVSATTLLGAAVTRIAIAYPLILQICERNGKSPSKAMFPLGCMLLCDQTGIPIGSGAVVFNRYNGFLEAAGYTFGDKFSIFAVLVDSIFLEALHGAPVPVVHLHGHLVFLRFPLGVENLVSGAALDYLNRCARFT